MTDEQIKHMVDRFLGWRLPDHFNPDAGISFKPDFNEHTPYPMKHEPSGTNLFDATQAEAMVRYMIDGMSRSDPDAPLFQDVPPKFKRFLASALRYYIAHLKAAQEHIHEGDRHNIDNDLPLYEIMLKDAEK